MERLTKKLPDGRNILTGNFAYVRNPKYGSFVEGYAVDKLADYEYAEEQGLLLRLPCKVGDTVYELINEGISCPILIIQTIFTLQDLPLFEEKRMFLTKEEAEQALKYMQEV